MALAQDKGGRSTASYLRDFCYVIERENAAVGCFITLELAPRGQRAGANKLGTISVQGRVYDRLHLWSIAE